MKVLLIDNTEYKTTKQIKKFLENHPGVELQTDPYFNPVKAEWADLIWVEWCEGTAQTASLLSGHFDDVVSDHQQIEKKDFDWSKARLVIRPIDIDVYYGHYRSVKWENVDTLVYIADHIFNIMDSEMHFKENFPKLNLVHMPLGINMEDWKFTERDGKKFNIAWINHNWTGKGLPLMLQAFKALRDTSGQMWKLHVVSCGWSNEAWYPPYIKHIIKELGLSECVFLHDRADSVNDFLDDYEIDYLVSSSYKEAFSLILAEAMAKGIKVLTHNWIGAKDIWPEDMIWTSIDDFVAKMLQGPYHSQAFRERAAGYSTRQEEKNLLEILKI